MAAAVKCCDELHDSTVDQVQYKCSISHRLRQCMNGGVSEEPQHAHHYHNHNNHHNHHSAQRHQQQHVNEQFSDFGYIPAMPVNSVAMPAGAYPVQYGYNQAGMIVPMHVPADSYQYSQNPYWSQVANNSAYPSVQAGQPMPFAYCSPYAQQYSVVNPPYYMQQSSQYYNEQAPAGVYTMPYTWGYPYHNTAEEENEVEAEVYTHTHSDVSYSVYPQSEHFQHQSFAHSEPSLVTQLPPAVTSPSAPVSVPASVTSPTSASPVSTPGVVTGFGAQLRPTASEMAAAVHGGASFTYIPCGVPAPASVAYQGSVQDAGHGANTQPSGLHGQHPHYQHYEQMQHQQHQQPQQRLGQQLQPTSTTGPSREKGAGETQQQVTQRSNPYAPRPKTWTDLFQAAIKEAHKQPAPASAAPVPPVVVPVLPLHRPAVSSPPQVTKQQVQSNKRPYAGPVAHKNNHQQQQHHHRQFQRSTIVKSASTGSLSGSASGSSTGSSGSSTGTFLGPRATGTAANSPAKSDPVVRAKELPVMVIGTGTSTGHSILVSSLRSHRDHKSFARSANLCTIVPRQRGPAVTPRSALCTATTTSVPEGIAACVASSDHTEKNGIDKLSTPCTTAGTILDDTAPTSGSIVSTPVKGHSNVTVSDAKTALSPTHEDTALDSVAVRVVSPHKLVSAVARSGEGRMDMM